MRLIGKLFYLVFLLLFISIGTIYLWFLITPLDMAKLPELRTGDLVFQTTVAKQSLPIGYASSSAYTHIGMVKIVKDQPIVVEAIGPVREVPLKDWVRQGMGQRLTVVRIDNLEELRAQKAFSQAEKYYGLPYDFYFLPDDSAIYCSELIYKSFAAAGVNLGKVQRLKELKADNYLVDKLIEERWKTDPMCKGMDFDHCYAEVMDQPLVTPASIAEDQHVKIIYSNYGFFK